MQKAAIETERRKNEMENRKEQDKGTGKANETRKREISMKNSIEGKKEQSREKRKEYREEKTVKSTRR